jgi:hypothetical protein
MVLGALALAAIVLGCLTVVAVAARGPSSLSPPSHSYFFPSWLAGPLGGAWPFPSTGATLRLVFDYAVVGMYPFYLLAVRYAPRLRRRWTIAAILAVHVIFLLSPPLALTDVFNYLNYGRMEIVHGLNPYATIPALEPHGDPAYSISNWHHLLSPYGPLFTLLTFALVPLGVATSFWIFKAALMLASLLGLLLVWRCAELLHRSPLPAVVLVGLNPAVLVWGLGGAHNDFLMVVLMMLAVYLLLSSRRRPFASALAVDVDRISPPGRLRRGARTLTGARRARSAPTPGPALGLAGHARASLALRLPALSRGPARGWGGVPALGPVEARVPGSGPVVGPTGAGAIALPPARVVAPPASATPAHPGPPAALWPPRRVAAAATREKALQFSAGAILVAAAAIKLPAAILVPILLAVAPRRAYLLAGMATGLLGVGLASYAAFGARLPDLGVQSNLVTAVGLPNLLGAGLGLGGETVGLREVLSAVLVVAVGLCAVWARRRHGDWIVPAGTAVLVLVLTLSWQAPWYVLWLLPLAALARRPHLRVATLLLGVYVVLAFTTNIVNLRPPSTPLQQVHSRETLHLVH